jgi:hypothetical protein
MAKVYVTARGHVYHNSRNCEWLLQTRDAARRLGRTLHPIKEVFSAGARKPCRVCVNGGECPRRRTAAELAASAQA